MAAGSTQCRHQHLPIGPCSLINKNPHDLKALTADAARGVREVAVAANELLNASAILLKRVKDISKERELSSAELAYLMLLFQGGGGASQDEAMFLASTARRLARESASAELEIAAVIGVAQTYTQRFLGLSNKPEQNMSDLHAALQLLRQEILYEVNSCSPPDNETTVLDQQLKLMIKVSQDNIGLALRSKVTASKLYHSANELVRKIEYRSS